MIPYDFLLKLSQRISAKVSETEAVSNDQQELKGNLKVHSRFFVVGDMVDGRNPAPTRVPGKHSFSTIIKEFRVPQVVQDVFPSTIRSFFLQQLTTTLLETNISRF